MVIFLEKNLLSVKPKPFKRGLITCISSPNQTKAITAPVAKMLKSANGIMTFQPSIIISSYLNRGNVALSHMQKKTRKKVFIRNQITGGRNGPCHPPK